MSDFAQQLRDLAEDRDLLVKVPRLAVEDVLVDFRDSGIRILGRNNGLVIKYFDGTPSADIRLTIEDALRIGLIALADHLEKEEKQ